MPQLRRPQPDHQAVRVGGWEHRGCGCHGIAHLPGVTSVRADLGRKVSCNAVHWQRRPQRRHQAVRETLLQPWECTEVGQGAVVAQPGLPAAGCGQCCLPSLQVVQSQRLVWVLCYSNCQARHAAPCSEGCAKLFMMPLSAKKRAQNQVGAASRCLICWCVRVGCRDTCVQGGQMQELGAQPSSGSLFANM